MELLSGLNSEQQKAVRHGEGPLLILAGAGSGKTRVLTHRIAWLVMEHGEDPGSILAITFTNKAAGEMKGRIAAMLGLTAADMWVGTFHSMCVRILRRDIEKVGYRRNFVIFDRQDQQTLVKDCIKALDLDDKMYPFRTVLEYIGRAKDAMIGPDGFLQENEADFRMKNIASIYEMYQKKLEKNNALDFDDIILKTVTLLENNPPVLEYYTRQFRHVLVDEYQDTNMAQYRLASLLARGSGNLCVVGDDDQTIFSWRGANIRNILEFEKEFKGCTVIKLEQNYRSTRNILSASNAVIKNNAGRKGKRLWTDSETGEPVIRYEGETGYDEASFIVSQIKELVKAGGMQYSDFAVLYRVNALSRVLEEAFVREGIPYKIFGGLKFYDRKEIKDVLAYMRLIQNTSDNISFKRVINVPGRGMGEVTVRALENIAAENGCSLFDAAATASVFPELKRAASGLVKFTGIIARLTETGKEEGVFALTEKVLDETGIKKELEEEDTIESRTRLENISELLSVAKEFETAAVAEGRENSLEEFLAGVSLVADIDQMDENPDYTALMTIHSAKGLEFPAVFIAGAEEGVFPGCRTSFEEALMEEERRLCYVGMTRAQKKLYMTNAKQRLLFGNTTYNRPSRFINEIPEDLIRWYGSGNATGNMCGSDRNKMTEGKNLTGQAGQVGAGYQWNRKAEDFLKQINDAADTSQLKPGDCVEHRKFGQGTIRAITGGGSEMMIEINFKGSGMKRLMAAFANLKKVN